MECEKAGNRPLVVGCPLTFSLKEGLFFGALVAFVHALDDGFGQVERRIGIKEVVPLL